MAGLYVHIPFCKQACHYCNFHFSTSLRLKTELLQAILKETALQYGYLGKSTVETIYFGGGTPSLLELSEISELLSQFYKFFTISENPEITLEANPDDLTKEKLKGLKALGINRLSIGVQSFHDADLQFMNRGHTGAEAYQSIIQAKEAGFENITIDLIYGTPTMTDEKWGENIQKMLQLGVPHISCYCLTVEPRTALDHFVKSGKFQDVDDRKSARQFAYLMEQLDLKGYEHYEISNFAIPGWYSRHNTSYWQHIPYLGLGPSAHSYDGTTRQWNLSHNAKYIQQVNEGQEWFEKEVLTEKERYNEQVMTGLRTKWGCTLKHFSENYRQHFLENIQRFVDQKLVQQEGDTYTLTNAGKIFADKIAMECFDV